MSTCEVVQRAEEEEEEERYSAVKHAMGGVCSVHCAPASRAETKDC